MTEASSIVTIRVDSATNADEEDVYLISDDGEHFDDETVEHWVDAGEVVSERMAFYEKRGKKVWLRGDASEDIARMVMSDEG